MTRRILSLAIGLLLVAGGIAVQAASHHSRTRVHHSAKLRRYKHKYVYSAHLSRSPRVTITRSPKVTLKMSPASLEEGHAVERHHRKTQPSHNVD
jgi:hypothetical protein